MWLPLCWPYAASPDSMPSLTALTQPFPDSFISDFYGLVNIDTAEKYGLDVWEKLWV
ncbi:DUF2612 domain-containing protein [Shigella flexneri]